MRDPTPREATILAVLLDVTGLTVEGFERLRRECPDPIAGMRRLRELAEAKGNTLVFIEGGMGGAPVVIIPKGAPAR